MSMRIRTNVASLTAQRHLSNNQTNTQQSFERLSSGYRINKSSDDAAGLAVSENLRGKIVGNNQAKRNANDAISLVQIAEGSMNEMSNILIRLRELSVQAASDTIGDSERSYLNKEYTQLVDEVDRIAGSTEFNGRMLFQEEDVDQYVIQVGTNASEPEDNKDTITIGLEGLRFNSEDLGLGKEAEIGPKESGESGPDREEIASRLGVIDTALNRFAKERANLGSIQSRLQSSINNLSITVENMETAKSRIRDVDFAQETANLTQARILSASNLSVLTQANQGPEMALQLLGR